MTLQQTKAAQSITAFQREAIHDWLMQEAGSPLSSDEEVFGKCALRN